MTELNNTEPYTHGQEVMVFDHRGNYEGRGKVIGVHRCNPWQYDIQPRGESSLSKRQCGIHHDRIRPIGKSYLAYDRKDEQPEIAIDLAEARTQSVALSCIMAAVEAGV